MAKITDTEMHENVYLCCTRLHIHELTHAQHTRAWTNTGRANTSEPLLCGSEQERRILRILTLFGAKNDWISYVGRAG